MPAKLGAEMYEHMAFPAISNVPLSRMKRTEDLTYRFRVS